MIIDDLLFILILISCLYSKKSTDESPSSCFSEVFCKLPNYLGFGDEIVLWHFWFIDLGNSSQQNTHLKVHLEAVLDFSWL